MSWTSEPFGVDSDYSSLPFFTRDSKYVMLPLQSGIGMCSVSSGQWIRRYSVTDMIVCFMDPACDNLVCAVTKQGQLRKFDISTGVECKTISIQSSHGKLVEISCGHASRNGKVIVVTPSSGSSYSVNLLIFHDDCVQSEKLFGLSCEPSKVFASDSNDSFYFCLLKNNTFVSFSSKGLRTSTVRGWNEQLYCGFPEVITLHPSKECVAIGWSYGQITLLFDFLNNHWNAKTKTLHWHAQPVQAICFSSEGSALSPLLWTSSPLNSKCASLTHYFSPMMPSYSVTLGQMDSANTEMKE
ncbi:hypothetical protein GJ496_007344 [Pomphorhynchus laevis]|nr:hypothetical protein GJ496_007344 [Pomphorhynchus laevis]